MKQVQKGFTLIELMIVVAIIGILAAVAIPAYQDYVVKSKLSKVQSTLDPVKLALAMYYQENGSFPNSADEATVWASIGLPAAGPTLPQEVSALAVDGTAGGGTSVTLTLTIAPGKIKASTIDGQTVEITGTAGSSAIIWTCTTGTTVSDANALKYFSSGQANPATCT